jgi:hypothetical protein
MAIHTQAKRLNSLNELKRVERAQAGTEVAQPFHAAANDESNGPKDRAEVHAVIGRRRSIDLRVAAL